MFEYQLSQRSKEYKRKTLSLVSHKDEDEEVVLINFNKPSSS